MLQQHHAIAIGGTYTNERPLAIRPMGVGHSRTLPHSDATTQVPYRRDRLFHQMGRGKTIGHYRGEKCLKFRLEKYHLLLRDPKVFVSNNGKKFKNDTFRDFCQQLGINNHYPSPAHPEASGQAEVTN